jgi:hypothetical protein
MCCRSVAAPDADAHQQRALGPPRAPGLNLKDSQLAGSALMLTARAGTTVEIACL